MLRKYIYKIFRREMFKPKFIGLFINPYYIARRNLYLKIKDHAAILKGNLLDFGCAHKPYKNLFTVDKYIGLDIEDRGHSHKNEYNSIDILYDGITIPFPDNHFESIFSSQVLEHVPEISKTLKELHRVCKNQGLVLLTVPFIWDEHELPYDFRRFTSNGIKHLMETHGFEVKKIATSSSYIHVITQMICNYISQTLLKNKYLQILLNPILVTPFLITGLTLNLILPKNKHAYLDTLIIAQKI